MLRGLIKSVAWGTVLAALGPLFVLGLPALLLSRSPEDALVAIRVVLIILGVALGVVVAAAIVFGLPLTLLLRHLRRESFGAYIGAGAALGFIAPLVLILSTGVFDQVWLAVAGMLAGGVSGAVWWLSFRQHQAVS